MAKLTANLKALLQPGIGRRFALWILVFSSLVTLVSTVVQLRIEYKRDVAGIQGVLEQIRVSYAQTLASSLWVTSQSDIQLQLNGMLRLPDMQYLEVSSPDRIEAKAGEKHDSRILRQDTPLYFEYLGKPVYVGKLVAVASLEGAYQRLKNKILVILVSQTIKTFLVSLFILFLFQLLVGRHLNKIAQHTEVLQLGSADQPLKLERRQQDPSRADELGKLEVALNNMNLRLITAYRSLKESEETTRLTIDAVQDYAILQLDSSGCVTTWNAGAQRIKGYRADEIIGQPHSVFYPPEEAAAGRPGRLLNQAATDGHCEDEGWRVRKDGSRFWARVSINAMRDEHGTLLGFSKITRDLTARKQADEQLEAYRVHLEDRVAARTAELQAAHHELSQFKSALDQTLDCVFMFDPDSLRFVYVNRGAVEHVGYSEAELLRLTPLDLKPEYDEARLRNEVLNPLRNGLEASHRFETVHRKKNGQLVPVEITIQLVTMAEDRQRFIAIVRDITQRRKHEALVQERTHALQVANKELEAFSYSVSHDLRAPLRAVDGFSQVLIEDYGDKLDESGQHYLKRVRASAQHMGVLIDDMLKLAQVTRTPLQLHELDLSAMAQEVVMQLHHNEPGRNVHIDISAGLHAKGDPGQLRIVLENLLGNAWKYTSKTTSAHIWFDAVLQDNTSLFRVRDNGAGFDMKYAGKLFGAFQRLHRKEEFEGTGIGLATVARIVHRHGGRVWADASPGQGATFFFTLDHPNTISNV